ncbi:Uncharacterised protein [Mycobacterium tuberculosis]|nr:Uncharacterised protein [Mycobacterium tuberculosis]
MTAMTMTMIARTTKMIDRVPCTAVLRMTACSTSGAPRAVSPESNASR